MASDNLDDIIRQNAPRLSRFVRSRVDNRDDADDIVQDTLYQLVRALSFADNPIGRVTSWLYTVAHNLIVNHNRRRREVAMPTIEHDEDDTFMTDLSEIMAASDVDNPDMLMLRGMVWDELERALASLPPEQREAIVLTEIRGLSTREAASATGVSVATFLSRKHYGVLQIRKRLRSLYDELV